MKQALDALNTPRPSDSYPPLWRTYVNTINTAIKALEEALKQEQGEPVAWDDLLKDAQQIVKDKFLYKRFIDGTPLANDIPCWMADFAQQYTTPQPRKPLTFEQVEDCFDDGVISEENGILISAQWLHDFARAIESAHGIKE